MGFTTKVSQLLLGVFFFLLSLRVILPFWGVLPFSETVFQQVTLFGLELVLFLGLFNLVTSEKSYPALRNVVWMVQTVLILLALVNLLYDVGVWGLRFGFVDVEFIGSMLLVESILLISVCGECLRTGYVKIS